MSTTFPNLIDGKQLDSTDRTTDINPSNLSDVVGEFARASASDIDEAIASARAAFKKWSRTNPQERFDVRRHQISGRESRAGSCRQAMLREGEALRIACAEHLGHPLSIILSGRVGGKTKDA